MPSKIPSINTKGLGRRSVRSGLVNMGSQGLSVALQLLSTVVLARLLTPASFGLIGMVMAVITFAGLFKDLGLSAATIQRKDLDTAQVSVLFWVNVVVGAGLSVLVALCSPLVVWFYGKPELLWVTAALGGNIFISSLGSQHAALLARGMRFKQLAVARVLGALGTFLVALGGALAGWEHWALVAGALGGSVCQCALLFVMSGWWPGLPRRNTGAREMIRYGLNLTGFELVNYFPRNLDNILIGKIWGSVALGYYSRAYRLIMFPISSIRTPLVSVALPGLSRLQSEPLRFRSYYRQLLSILAFTTMPVAAFTFVAPEMIVEVLLGSQWLAAATYVRWLAVAAFLQPVAGLFGAVLMALGLANRHFRCGLTSSIILSIVFLVSIHWGVETLAISYAVCGYFLFVPIFLYASKGTGIYLSDFFLGCWRPGVASLITVGVSLFFDSRLPETHIFVQLVILGFGFAFSYLGLIAVLPGGYREMKLLVKRVVDAIRSKRAPETTALKE